MGQKKTEVTDQSPEYGGSSSSATAQAEPGSQGAPGLAMTLGESEAVWPRIIDYVKAKRMSIGIFLSESEPVEITDHVVTLGLPVEFQFHKETLEKLANKSLVEEAFEAVTGKKVRVQFVVTKTPDLAQAGSGEDAETPETVADSQLPDIIMQAVNIFDGAKIVRKDG